MQRNLTIDGRFLTQARTGVQRYAREIVAELDAQLQNEPLQSSLCARLVKPSGPANPLELAVIDTQTSGVPIGELCGPNWSCRG